MKPVIIIAIAFVLLIPLGGSNLIQQSYAQSEDLEGIELELVEWKKIESDKSDVLVLTISFINNGKYVSDIIPNYVYLVDSQERTFGPSYYSDLQEKGFPITIEDCPLEFHTSSNPGLSSEEILCYEVPKGIGDSFSLDLWSSLPSLCEYYECTFKSYPFTLTQQSELRSSDSSEISHWVENILAWYEEGGISEDEMRNAIEWLMNKEILKEDYLEKELSTQTLQSCSGSARCITGVVTKVIDGDTIKVDGQSIRFALASAPELGSYGAGVKETEFIQSICPVGSTALVDEDDEQTQGSYGRIVGVVYCNGMNLNSELLDADLGYMDFKFCDISEFGNSDWAIKHGCKSKVTTLTENDCDPSYPDFCIPSSPPDLDCKDIPQKRFTVLQPDPHRFDGDKDGIGCES